MLWIVCFGTEILDIQVLTVVGRISIMRQKRSIQSKKVTEF